MHGRVLGRRGRSAGSAPGVGCPAGDTILRSAGGPAQHSRVRRPSLPPRSGGRDRAARSGRRKTRSSARAAMCGPRTRPGSGAGDEFGLGVAWVGARVAPFPHRLPDGKDAVPRALRAQVPSFVEPRSHDLGRRTIDETRRGEPVEDRLPLLAPGPGGRRTGLRMPGSGPPAAIERGPRPPPAPDRPA